MTPEPQAKANARPAAKPDITSRGCLRELVNAFYGQVQKDATIGFIFNEIAAVDWDHHLPKMVDFWEAILFRRGNYQGNPLIMHAALARRTPIGKEQFTQWLALFCATVDDLFAGPNATHIKNCARDIADVLHRRINPPPGAVPVVSAVPLASPDVGS